MDYANGKIYKITGGGLTYYGSTIQLLSKRMYTHRTKLTCSSRIIMETGEAVIVLVELCPCKSKEELFSRERWFIENNECVNKNIPTRTSKEYYIANKDKNKQYRIDNADKIKQYRIDNDDKIKQYRIDNADKKKQYRINNADKIKQYRIDNADKKKELDKLYRINNANKIKQYRIDKKKQKNK